MNYSKDFETFWQKYPRRWNSNLGIYVKRKKFPAWEKWKKLSVEIRRECLSKVHLIKQTEGGAIRDAVTWLNQHGWSDIETVPQGTGLPKEMIENLFKIDYQEDSVNKKVNRQRELLGLN